MPSSNRFPALRLPLLPLEQITKYLTPIDIFFLALCSKKTIETLEMLSLKLDDLHLAQEDNGFIRVRLSKQENVYDMKLEAIPLLEWPGNRDGSKNLKMNRKPYRISYACCKAGLWKRNVQIKDLVVLKEAVSSISKLLSKVFTAQKVSSLFCEVPKEVVLPVVSTRFSNIYNVYLEHETQELSSDDLSMLLDNCSISQLTLDWSVEEGVKYRKSLRYPEMILHDAHWFTTECLLSMNCVSLEAHDVLLTVEDVKRFLRKWLDGGFEQLRCIKLTHSDDGKFSWQAVMDNIEKKPNGQHRLEAFVRKWLEDGFNELQSSSWHSLLDDLEEKTLLNEQDREAHFKHKLMWNVWEIKRSDGKRAGVCASKDFTFKVL